LIVQTTLFQNFGTAQISVLRKCGELRKFRNCHVGTAWMSLLRTALQPGQRAHNYAEK